MKTGGKLLRYIDGLVQGILFYIEKLPTLWERMRIEKDKMFYKIALHQKLFFRQKYWAPHTPCIIFDFSIPWVKVGC
jgi:hypothetical protein